MTSIGSENLILSCPDSLLNSEKLTNAGAVTSSTKPLTRRAFVPSVLATAWLSNTSTASAIVFTR